MLNANEEKKKKEKENKSSELYTHFYHAPPGTQLAKYKFISIEKVKIYF